MRDERAAMGPWYRIILRPLLLCAAIFAVARYSMSFLQVAQGISGFWLPNGLALAALLRTPRRQWPVLVIAALAGNIAAALYSQNSSLPVSIVRSTSSAFQYCLCAYVLRRRFGEYFDLLEPGHLAWLGAIGGLSTLLKIGLQLIWLDSLNPGTSLTDTQILSWTLNNFLGLFVLALPLLAITARSVIQSARFDRIGLALLVLLLAELAFIFGPPAFPGLYIVMPVLMLLAWRHGLLGAGVGTLLTVIVVSGFGLGGGGLQTKLIIAGYSPAERGTFMELFYSVAILMSLPLAVARARQQATDAELAAALAAAESRAAQLADSEAAARQSEKTAREAEQRLRDTVEDHKRAEDHLRLSEERFRAMFAAAPLGIALMDTADGYFLDVNPMFATIAGWSHDELLTLRWQDITHPDDLGSDIELATQFIAGAINGYWMEKRYLRRDGEPVRVNMTIVRFALPGQIGQRHLCMIEDVTERRALEKQVHIAQRMDAIGQLTGGVSHDFNNLLTIVIGSSETLIEQLDNPQHRMLAELILQAAEQGGELTRQLLAFSRRQPLAPHPFDVDKMLDSMAPLVRRTLAADLSFSIEVSPALRPAFADPAQTESAILNLCLNARDAMPEGGKLTIATENIHLSEAYVRRHPEARVGDYVAIRVSDTGTGISPDLIDRIFEPFFTTKETGKGTGLGLSMVYGFIQQSKGCFELTSEMGRGTTFTLYLPAADSDAATIPIPGHEGEAIERGSENVLIVEDNELVRDHARSQFERLGYHVTVASTGAEALAILEQQDDIDLLFTDIVMPGGMNGRQLGERALARWPSLRILYTSGYSRDALTQDGRLLENVTLLSKPYSIRDLSEKARKVLDEVP